MGSSFRPLSIYSSLLVVSTIIGYFGVSDADVVLRDLEDSNGLLLNKPQQQSEPHAFRHNSINNDKMKMSQDDSKDAENESVTIDESMWEQLVIRALANPTEWVQLRQALDKVDEDLRALTSLENSKRNQSKSVPKWKFTYHRVTSPQFTGLNQSHSLTGNVPSKAKAFAAISLATPQNSEQEQQQEQQQQQPEHQEAAEQSSQVKGILPPSMINHKLQQALESRVVDSYKTEENPPSATGRNRSYGKDKPKWKTSENLSHYYVVKEDEKRRKQEEEEEQMRMTRKSSKNQNPSGGSASFSAGSRSSSNNQGNWSWAIERRSSSGRSRTQLEEEIAKMSSSRSNDASSHRSSFHWRPWIRHGDFNRNDGNTIGSSSTTATTSTTPSPTKSARLNDHHKNTWSEELLNYHDQLHASSFSHFHHHHHQNHPHGRSSSSNPSSSSNVNKIVLLTAEEQGNKDDAASVLYNLGDNLQKPQQQSVDLSEQGYQSEQQANTNQGADENSSWKKKSKHRQRHHTHPGLHHIPSSESSVDPVFSMHRSTQLEYRI